MDRSVVCICEGITHLWHVHPEVNSDWAFGCEKICVKKIEIVECDARNVLVKEYVLGDMIMKLSANSYQIGLIASKTKGNCTITAISIIVDIDNV